MQGLLLCVTYTAKPGMREKFVNEIVSGGILEKIRNEEGCLSYDYYYAASEEDKILLVERWESEEHQKVHMGQPHMEQLKAVKDAYILDVQLEKFC